MTDKRKDIAKILEENCHYSPQVGALVIHGAIDKIIEYFTPSLNAGSLEQDFEELNHYFTDLYHHGVNQVKDSGNLWTAFTDKFNAFRERVLTASRPSLDIDKVVERSLAQYNAVEPEPWKNVEKDGYPEYNRGLIVCIPDEDYHITSGMWDRDNKWVLLDDYRVPDCPVTHYMPLPKLPKEFEKEVSENDAVMEHLAKLLKMGKIKKPETFPSQSPQTPIDREPEGERTKKEIADFLNWCSHLAWFDNDTQLWNTHDESLDPFRYTTDEMMQEYISCDKDSEKFENKHSQ